MLAERCGREENGELCFESMFREGNEFEEGGSLYGRGKAVKRTGEQ